MLGAIEALNILAPLPRLNPGLAVLFRRLLLSKAWNGPLKADRLEGGGIRPGGWN
jgi:hypothetical protein